MKIMFGLKTRGNAWLLLFLLIVSVLIAGCIGQKPGRLIATIVHGDVVDEEGNPLAGVKVKIEIFGHSSRPEYVWYAKTNEEGYFRKGGEISDLSPLDGGFRASVTVESREGDARGNFELLLNMEEIIKKITNLPDVPDEPEDFLDWLADLLGIPNPRALLSTSFVLLLSKRVTVVVEEAGEKPPKPVGLNNPPVIKRIEFSASQVKPGDVFELTIVAEDPDGNNELKVTGAGAEIDAGDLGLGRIQLGPGLPFKTTLTVPKPKEDGKYVIKAIVWDNFTAKSSPVAVELEVLNVPPAIEGLGKISGKPGEKVKFSVKVRDDNGEKKSEVSSVTVTCPVETNPSLE